MRSNQRAALLVAAAVVIVIGFVLANAAGPSKSTAPVARRFDVVVAAGQPVGGVRQLTANQGDTINLTVHSNVADEIHIHGYDLRQTVPAGGTVRFGFRAKIDGIFVIELESHAKQIASLTVKA